MHYHLEIIMPPTDNVELAVKEIMKPFSENGASDEDEEYAGYGFWDFWVIGGRWAGVKLEEKMGRDRINEFANKLAELKITVSGLVWGKQKLSPSSQIETVDALWRDWFPESGVDKCPLFAHSNNQLSSDSTIKYDICQLDETPLEMECEKVIVATDKGYRDNWEATFMCSDSLWNGVTHEKTEWSGTLKHALELLEKNLSYMTDEYKNANTPKPNWLTVTVDYHS